MKSRHLFPLSLMLFMFVSSCWSGRKMNDSPADLARKLENPNALEMLIKVGKLDSANIEPIQARLSEEEGVIRNFACYSDSNIFVKIDTSKIKTGDIIELIESMGFPVLEAPDPTED